MTEQEIAIKISHSALRRNPPKYRAPTITYIFHLITIMYNNLIRTFT